MAPEESEPVKVDVTLDGEPGQLPEEALAEVQRLLSPEHLVPEKQPQGGDVGTGSGNKDVKRLGVFIDCPDLAMWTISEPVPCSSSHSTVSLWSRSPTTSSKLQTEC